MDHVINLEMGDDSGDGHGKTESVAIKCSHSAKELRHFYIKGCKILGEDYDEFIEEYESSKIPYEAFKKLVEAGYDGDIASLSKDEVENGIWIWTGFWVKIYMFIAFLGSDKTLKWEPFKMESIDIGGYGLFQ
jgi:hypothetical protein